MTNIQLGVFIALVLHIQVNAAPSELLEKIENVAKSKQNEKSITLIDEGNNDNNATVQGVRQKRFYNHFGYGFPPFNPAVYPSYTSNDFGSYGAEDHFGNIYKRLQDIVTVIRQPNLPPQPHQLPPPFPIYYPVFYIPPPTGCSCTPDQATPTPSPNVPITPSPDDKNDTSDFDISNRFPEMDDDRQNWGLVVNETDLDDGLPDDFTRPISFDPIRPSGRPTRPQPPVEHGSSQSGNGSDRRPTTTARPLENAPQGRPAPSPPAPKPSPCDAAVISCCHQLEVTYDCFAALGCPDPSSYGNPCDNQVILGVIDRYQRFYGLRSG